jgi:single-stranded DNA-binding protein
VSKSSVFVEGFVATELVVRNAGDHRVLDVTVPVTPQKLVDGKWEDSGETVWWKASFWNDHTIEVLSKVDKGTLVQISGDGVEIDSYEKDGKVRASLKISNPVIAVVVRRPKKGAVQAAPVVEAASEGDVWNTPGTYDDSTPF